jgi:hypothetical protein
LDEALHFRVVVINLWIFVIVGICCGKVEMRLNDGECVESQARRYIVVELPHYFPLPVCRAFDYAVPQASRRTTPDSRAALSEKYRFVNPRTYTTPM